MGSASPHEPADLERAWGRALYRWWEFYDREYLHGVLQRPQVQLGDSQQRLGEWDPSRRRITISRNHIRTDPWNEVLDTMRHEMAHQYVWEVLHAGEEDPHGPAFREACRKLRCDPKATARRLSTGADAEQDHAEVRVARLVKKLLSLSDSPNQNEAQAAVNKAQRLLLEYNIELVDTDGARGFERRQLGAVKGRHPAWELWLAMILNEFFFVEVLWIRSYEAGRDLEGTVLEVYGTPTNLDMADYVHAYLSQLLERLWAAYRRERGLRSNRERMRYFAGVLQGFHEKLGRQRGDLEVSAKNSALVWQGDDRLIAYYRHHNPRIQTRQTGGVAASDAFRHGVEEGRQVNLRRPVTAAAGFGGYLSRGGLGLCRLDRRGALGATSRVRTRELRVNARERA